MRCGKRVCFLVLILAVVFMAFGDDNNTVPSGKYSLSGWEINGMDMMEFFKMMSELADESPRSGINRDGAELGE